MKFTSPLCCPSLGAALAVTVSAAGCALTAQAFAFGGSSPALSRAAFLSLTAASNKRPYSSLPAAFSPAIPSAPSPSSLFAFSSSLVSEGDWHAFLDEDTTGLVYYFNAQTGESIWKPPTASFPAVELHGWRERRSRRKLREYKNSRAWKEDAANNIFGSFVRLVEGATAAAGAVAAAMMTAEKEQGEHKPKMVDGKANGSMGAEKECEWHAFLDDETTGLVYYFNARTGESVWEPPASYISTHSTPAHLSRREKRLSRRKLEEYRASEAWAQAKKGFLGMVEEQVGTMGEQMSMAAAGLSENLRGKLMTAVTEGLALGAGTPREEIRGSPNPASGNVAFGWNEHNVAPYKGLFDWKSNQ